MIKISRHFTTSPLTAGFLISLLSSVWLYGAWAGVEWRGLNTATGLLFFYALMATGRITWFWAGFFIGLFWFWWIAVSFVYYHMGWAIPIALIVVGLMYGGMFWLMAWVADKITRIFLHYGVPRHTLHGLRKNIPLAPCSLLPALILKSFALLAASYLHPFGFDWFKPELLFVSSYLGIQKWQLAIILLAIALTQWHNRPLWLLLVVLAYSPIQVQSLPDDPQHTIKLVATNTTIAEKWNPDKTPVHIQQALDAIDVAIASHYPVVVLPESVFPFFLNRRPTILGKLIARSQKIDIIIGALYWDHGIHRNSTYHFHQGHYAVANKVILVPFGEANPLPNWAGKWINQIFFDGSVDYAASPQPTDWTVRGDTYRNAICYEATSERLYEGHPTRMILTSSNAWFVPSIEPTFQRLLLSYYVRKYGTTIYHAANMSQPYILRRKRP